MVNAVGFKGLGFKVLGYQGDVPSTDGEANGEEHAKSKWWDCTRVSRGRLSKRYPGHKGFAEKGATQPTWRFMGLSN